MTAYLKKCSRYQDLLNFIPFFTFLYRIEELAGFTSQDMIGKSIYDFHHGLDCEKIEKAFKDRKYFISLVLF